MRQELLKEMYESVETINRVIIDDELTDFAKQVIIKEEQQKQINVRKLLEAWNQV